VARVSERYVELVIGNWGLRIRYWMLDTGYLILDELFSRLELGARCDDVIPQGSFYALQRLFHI
jgi:hypothetical protein